MSDPGPYPKDVSQCRGCGSDIVFLRTKGRKWIPVNVVPTDADLRGPNAGEDKFKYRVHQAHFDTCTDAPVFRKVEHRGGGKRIVKSKA